MNAFVAILCFIGVLCALLFLALRLFMPGAKRFRVRMQTLAQRLELHFREIPMSTDEPRSAHSDTADAGFRSGLSRLLARCLAPVRAMFAFYSSSWSMDGHYSGFRILIRQESRGTEDRDTLFVYRLFFPEPLGAPLHLTRSGLIDAMRKRAGLMTQRRLGDDVFDDRVTVTCDDAFLIERFLTPQRRAVVLRYLQGEGCRFIDEQGVGYETMAVIADETRVRSILDRMATVAAELIQ